jgi:hypothetical protein
MINLANDELPTRNERPQIAYFLLASFITYLSAKLVSLLGNILSKIISSFSPPQQTFTLSIVPLTISDFNSAAPYIFSTPRKLKNLENDPNLQSTASTERTLRTDEDYSKEITNKAFDQNLDSLCLEEFFQHDDTQYEINYTRFSNKAPEAKIPDSPKDNIDNNLKTRSPSSQSTSPTKDWKDVLTSMNIQRQNDKIIKSRELSPNKERGKCFFGLCF